MAQHTMAVDGWYAPSRCAAYRRCEGTPVVDVIFYYPSGWTYARQHCEWHLWQLVKDPYIDEHCEGLRFTPLGSSPWLPPSGPFGQPLASDESRQPPGWYLDQMPDPAVWRPPEPRWSPASPREERRADLLIPRHPRLARLIDTWKWPAVVLAVCVALLAVLVGAVAALGVIVAWLIP